MRGESNQSLFDRPGEEDPVQEIEAEDSTVATHSYGNGNEEDERKKMGIKYDKWMNDQVYSKENNHVIDYVKWTNSHVNSNFHKDDFIMPKDEVVHDMTLKTDNEMDYLLDYTDLNDDIGDPYADSLDSGDAFLDGVLFDEDDYADYEVVPYGTDDADYTPGESGNRTLRGIGTDRRLQQDCAASKMITLYKFCIDGSCDKGSHGEHRFRLDGSFLHEDEIDIPEGACTNLGQYTLSKIVAGSSWKALTVGTYEDDGLWGTEKYVVQMPASQWYSSSCGTYEVRMNKKFKSAVTHTACLDVSLSANYAEAIEGSITSSKCQTWETPAESFTWYLKVEPLYLPSWKKMHNGRYWNVVMDLHMGWATPYQPVNVRPDRDHYTENAQYWYMDVMGRIKSKKNPGYCLEGGVWGDLYRPLYVHYCHDGPWQQWEWNNSRLKNKFHKKYIGVKHCGTGQTGNLELQHYLGGNGNCAKSQKWYTNNN